MPVPVLIYIVSDFKHNLFENGWTLDIPSSNVSQFCSGVAGPLAAQGGGQICRPFVLGF